MKIPRHFFEKPHWENSYLEGMKRKKLDKKFNLRAKVMFIHIWISVSVFCVIIFPIPDTKKDSIVQCWGGYPLGAWLETSCMNHVVAGDGLMLHAEQFRLRTNSDAKGDCHDYIGLFSQYSSLYSHKSHNFYDRVWAEGQHPSVFLAIIYIIFIHHIYKIQNT